jgi:hypothetical protein
MSLSKPLILLQQGLLRKKGAGMFTTDIFRRRGIGEVKAYLAAHQVPVRL